MEDRHRNIFWQTVEKETSDNTLEPLRFSDILQYNAAQYRLIDHLVPVSCQIAVTVNMLANQLHSKKCELDFLTQYLYFLLKQQA